MTDPGMSEFDRGHAAGGIAERLDNHDRHFTALNGSLADVARNLSELTLAVQRLGDQAVSRDATVITTAAALKDAEAARRGRAEQSWSPVQKALALIAGLGVLLGAYFAIKKG